MTEPQLFPSQIAVPAEAAWSSPRRPAAKPARKRSVLVVENQVEVVAAIFAALDPATHHVEMVSCESAAAALVEDRAIDIVLLSLSNADGVRTMIELKRGSDTPVVALVGGRDHLQINYQLRMATATGANGAVVKPFVAERLRVVIDTALRTAAASA